MRLDLGGSCHEQHGPEMIAIGGETEGGPMDRGPAWVYL